MNDRAFYILKTDGSKKIFMPGQVRGIDIGLENDMDFSDGVHAPFVGVGRCQIVVRFDGGYKAWVGIVTVEEARRLEEVFLGGAVSIRSPDERTRAIDLDHSPEP